MKVTVDIHPEIEKLLLKKCEKTQTEPSELVKLLVEWYFLKFKKSRNEGSSGFIKIANQCAMERVKNCRYSDGKTCAREVFNDIMAEKDPEPIVPYKCLFCQHFVDRREPKAKNLKKERDGVDQIHDIAKVAARMVVELYGDKLGYRSNQESDQVEEEALTEKKIEELLENW
ncbi:MAG: hypothetical protein ACOC5L_00545 [Halobacteriota archaeon]